MFAIYEPSVTPSLALSLSGKFSVEAEENQTRSPERGSWVGGLSKELR